MIIYETRRNRLRELVARSSLSSFCDKIDRSKSLISDCISGRKNIGERLARAIEQKAGLPIGYLDGTATETAGARPTPYRSYVYPIETLKDGDDVILTSRDVPHFVWYAEPGDDVIEKAAEGLMIGMEYFLDTGKPIPPPSEQREGEIMTYLPVTFVSKIMLHNAMIEKKISPADLSAKLGVPDSEVAKITNFHHKTKIDTMVKALNSVGVKVSLVCVSD